MTARITAARRLLAAALTAAALGAAGAQASGGAQPAAGEFSDAAIARRIAALDADFSAVQLEVEKEFQDSVAFHARLKQERLDFERERLDARKRMLESLSGLPASERKKEYERFHAEESARRREFARRVLEEKQAFRRQFLDQRGDARRERKLRRAP